MELNHLKKIVSQFKNNVFYNVFQMNLYKKKFNAKLCVNISNAHTTWMRENEWSMNWRSHVGYNFIF
jgi:hypothetical protein